MFMKNKPLIAANLECHRKEKELRVFGAPGGSEGDRGQLGSTLQAEATPAVTHFRQWSKRSDLFCRSAASSLRAGKNRGPTKQVRATDYVCRKQTGICEGPPARIHRRERPRGIDARGRSHPRRDPIPAGEQKRC